MKDWTEMWIRVEGNTYTPTNMLELNDRDGYSNRIEKHQMRETREKDTENLKGRTQKKKREYEEVLEGKEKKHDRTTCGPKYNGRRRIFIPDL